MPPELGGGLYDPNALDLAKFYLARGRYEIASEFHARGTAWYEANLVRRRLRGDSLAERAARRERLKAYRAYQAEFPRLIETREAILARLSDSPQGIDREELGRSITHEGVTSFDAICSQLDKGGWIRQVSDGQRTMLFPSPSRPLGDDEFRREEFPSPEGLPRRSEQIAPKSAAAARRWWQFWR
jgi:hypothetical protein